MINIDQHVHSNISHDGISSIEDYISHAHSKQIDEITFTEHYDDYKGIETNLKTLDINKYRKEYLRYMNNQTIKINYGIEIGLRPESYELITKMVKDNSFDFIIGSSHITCGKDIAYDKSFFEDLTPHESIVKYLSEVLENINLYKNEFDAYGHLDYVIRYVIKNYGKVMDKIEYSEFNEILDEILLSLIKSDKGIEINTSGFRYGLSTPHPNIDIIKRYKELGGKIITVGSDAHQFSDLGSYFDKVYDIFELLKIDEIALYHNRYPELIKVKK